MHTLSELLEQKYDIPSGEFREIKSSVDGDPIKACEFLIKKKRLTEKNYLEAVSMLFNIPISKTVSYNGVDINFANDISITFLKKYMMVPVVKDEESIENEMQDPETDKPSILIYNPFTLYATDDLARHAKLDSYNLLLAGKDQILSIINYAYDHSRDSAEQLVQDMEDTTGIIHEIEEITDLLDDTSESKIIRLVNHIISQAIKAKASDIHLEPFQDSFKVRYRIDGTLYDFLTPPKWVQSSLISRIKVMANLNIAEKRIPQDGRIEVKIGDMDIDIRVSTIPISHGERVVLRLLNKSGALLNLSQFGIDQRRYKLLLDLIKSPNGIILVTGPTGSGKTTTLYAILSKINSPEINIVTIEDPVEYQLEGIGQIQVNTKIDLTFAVGLRSIVRQDPDVILVGEIRDPETAEIAVQSALTGHLVFSTLHTNDSASTITRMVDLGIEPFLITSSVKAIVAQRLLRELCSSCKEVYDPDDSELAIIGLTRDQMEGFTIYRSVGCPDCFETGYRGRIPIFEILIMEDNLKSLILETSDSNQILKAAKKNNLITLREDGIRKVLRGMTSIEEIFRKTI